MTNVAKFLNVNLIVTKQMESSGRFSEFKVLLKILGFSNFCAT